MVGWWSARGKINLPFDFGGIPIIHEKWTFRSEPTSIHFSLEVLAGALINLGPLSNNAMFYKASKFGVHYFRQPHSC